MTNTGSATDTTGLAAVTAKTELRKPSRLPRVFFLGTGCLGTAAVLGTALFGASPARAFEAETTVAGVVEQAALRSRLHRRLMARFSHPLGVLEPLRLDLSGLKSSPALASRTGSLTALAQNAVVENPRSGLRSRSIYGRLVVLNPAEGYSPEWQQDGAQVFPLARLHALGWLAAGSVIEHSPGVRARHHFFNPATGQGLSRRPDQGPQELVSQSVGSGLSTVREAMTGTAFDGTGLPAPDWIASESNDLGYPAFLRAHERAVVAATAVERDSALAEALLCAGSMMGVLSQMADPAYVRGDLQAVLSGDGAGRVSQRFGRAAIPASPVPTGAERTAAALPHHIRELFADGEGGGLAESTARRCQPAWGCYAGGAVAQLHDATRQTRRLLDYLFRGELSLSLHDGSLRIQAEEWSLGSGSLLVLVEDADQTRRLLQTVATPPTLAGGEVAQLPLSAADLAGAARVVVLFRGRDRYQEPLVTAAQILLSSDASKPAAP